MGLINGQNDAYALFDILIQQLVQLIQQNRFGAISGATAQS